MVVSLLFTFVDAKTMVWKPLSGAHYQRVTVILQWWSQLSFACLCIHCTFRINVYDIAAPIGYKHRDELLNVLTRHLEPMEPAEFKSIALERTSLGYQPGYR